MHATLISLRKHARPITLALLALTAAAGAQVARADAIPYPNSGTPNPVTYSFTAATTGDVTAYFAGSSAAYTETLGLGVNGVLTGAGFGLTNHASSIGQASDLGHANAGDTLTFVLDVVSPNLGFVYSDPSLNGAYDSNGTDGHNHICSTAYTATSPILPGVPTGTYVAFEDLPFPGSDFNYFDETYVFSNTTTTIGTLPPVSSVPERASMTLLSAGLIGLVGLLRRRKG